MVMVDRSGPYLSERGYQPTAFAKLARDDGKGDCLKPHQNGEARNDEGVDVKSDATDTYGSWQQHGGPEETQKGYQQAGIEKQPAG